MFVCVVNTLSAYIYKPLGNQDNALFCYLVCYVQHDDEEEEEEDAWY